jgi:hypothetical protein
MGRLAIIASGVFLAMLVLLAPLRLALAWLDADAAGLSAARVEGTIWSGRLHDAAYRGLRLGDARLRFDPLRFGLRLTAAGEAAGSGVVGLGAGRLALRDLDAAVPLARLAPALPLRGNLTFQDVRIDMGDGGCRIASGVVQLREAAVAGARLPGLELSGQPACRGGRLVLPLAGQAAGVLLESVVTIEATGAYRIQTRLRTTDPAMLAAAGLGGFERGLDGFSRTDRGRLDAVR